MKQYVLPEDLANALLQYIATKPYGEVFKLVDALGRLREVKEAETESSASHLKIVESEIS